LRLKNRLGSLKTGLEPQNRAECLKNRIEALKSCRVPEKTAPMPESLILAWDFGREWAQEPPFPEEPP